MEFQFVSSDTVLAINFMQSFLFIPMNKLATAGIVGVMAVGGVFGADVQLNTLEDKGGHFERVLVNDVADAGVSKVELMKDKPKIILSKLNH